jgi:ATP-dependent Zn protease
MLDIGDDTDYSYNELGEGIAGRYTSPMRRYSFDDTTTGYNHNINYNNNNDQNMNVNAIMSNNNNNNNSNNSNNNSITYESPSTSPRGTNDTKGINILPLLLLILTLIFFKEKKKRITSAKKKTIKKTMNNDEDIYTNTNSTANMNKFFDIGGPYKIKTIGGPSIRPSNLPRI